MTAEDILNEFNNSKEYKSWKNHSIIFYSIMNGPNDGECVDIILTSLYSESHVIQRTRKSKSKYPEKRLYFDYSMCLLN